MDINPLNIESGEESVNEMGKIIAKNVVQREKGFLYYVDKEGNVCKSKMNRGRKKK